MGIHDVTVVRVYLYDLIKVYPWSNPYKHKVAIVEQFHGIVSEGCGIEVVLSSPQPVAIKIYLGNCI